MEDQKLIYRTQHPEDGRSVLIHLTAFGREKRELSKSVVLSFNELVNNQLTEAQIRNFYHVIECIKEQTQKMIPYESKTITNPI